MPKSFGKIFPFLPWQWWLVEIATDVNMRQILPFVFGYQERPVASLDNKITSFKHCDDASAGSLPAQLRVKWLRSPNHQLSAA